MGGVSRRPFQQQPAARETQKPPCRLRGKTGHVALLTALALFLSPASALPRRRLMQMTSPPPPPPNMTTVDGNRTLGMLPTGPTLAQQSVNTWARYTTVGMNYTDKRDKPNWILKNDVDWRSRLSPVVDQDAFNFCSACWAFAAAVSIEGMRVALGLPSEPLSVQQLVDCSVDDCWGGYATDAFESLVSTKGIVSNASYPYEGFTNTGCSIPTDATRYEVSMYERIRVMGPTGLLLAAQYQPVVVQIAADSSAFAYYNGTYIFNDTDCFITGIRNHELLLVGYHLGPSGIYDPGSYFILRNSWGEEWGDKGYLYLAIGPPSRDGICGIWSGPGFYPQMAVPKGASDPCKSKPCGGGICTASISGAIPYKCSCNNSWYLVNATNIDGTPTCTSKLVCTLSYDNPCGVGTCVDDLLGGYYCICPHYFKAVNRTDGASMCAPSELPEDSYTVQSQDSCPFVSMAKGLTLSRFRTLNPAVDCTADTLPLGKVLNVSSIAPRCGMFYTVDVNDTCSSIYAKFSMNSSMWTVLNPGLDCSELQPGLQICILEAASYSEVKSGVECLEYYTAQEVDTCNSIANDFNLTSTEFYGINQGTFCTQLEPGASVCVRRSKAGARPCKKNYKCNSGETCSSLYPSVYKSEIKYFVLLNSCACLNKNIFAGKTLCAPWW